MRSWRSHWLAESERPEVQPPWPPPMAWRRLRPVVAVVGHDPAAWQKAAVKSWRVRADSAGGVTQKEELEEEARRSPHGHRQWTQTGRKGRAMDRGELGLPLLNKGRRKKEGSGVERGGRRAERDRRRCRRQRRPVSGGRRRVGGSGRLSRVAPGRRCWGRNTLVNRFLLGGWTAGQISKSNKDLFVKLL